MCKMICIRVIWRRTDTAIFFLKNVMRKIRFSYMIRVIKSLRKKKWLHPSYNISPNSYHRTCLSPPIWINYPKNTLIKENYLSYGQKLPSLPGKKFFHLFSIVSHCARNCFIALLKSTSWKWNKRQWTQIH